jgi:hypothetical protein
LGDIHKNIICDEDDRACEEVWDIATWGEHIGQERGENCERKRIESTSPADIYILMDVPLFCCRILGSGDFVAEIIREAEKKVRRYLRVSEMNSSIDNANKEMCGEEGVGEQELRLGVRSRKFSRARAKIAYHLSHEFGISRAEIARQLGVCTSAIAKAIQNMEGAENKC